MDQTLLYVIEFWVMTGALIGGVVTPLIFARKGQNDWLGALIGVVVGGVGNLILLLPLWLVLLRMPDAHDPRLPWQRDAVAEGEALPPASAPLIPTLLALLKENFWSASRPAHSHRTTYIGVFVALAVITLVEVLITVIEMPFNPVGPLVALSTTKVILVVMYFMHLRFDSKWYAAVFVLSLPFAAMVLTVLAVA